MPIKRYTNELRATFEHTAWRSMIARCSIPSASNYDSYGGRGIRVCDEWRQSFEAFFEHLGLRPSPRHSLDRIDVNGDYEPGNVRWATIAQQQRNKRNNRYLEIDGERLILQDWATRSPVSSGAISRRLDAGWSPRDAVFQPSQNDGDRPLRKPADFQPWTCGPCGTVVEGTKPGAGRCPPCQRAFIKARWERQVRVVACSSCSREMRLPPWKKRTTCGYCRRPKTMTEEVST